MTPAEMAAVRLLAASRKAKRLEKGLALGLRPRLDAQGVDGGPKTSNGRTDSPKSRGGRLNAKRKPKAKSMSRLKKDLWEELRHVVYAQSSWCVACLEPSSPVACHIVPKSDGMATAFFLPNIYRGCNSCNDAERRRRGQWVKWHEQIFGTAYVDALYSMSRETFQIKRAWVLEQTERMRKLRARS